MTTSETVGKPRPIVITSTHGVTGWTFENFRKYVEYEARSLEAEMNYIAQGTYFLGTKRHGYAGFEVVIRTYYQLYMADGYVPVPSPDGTPRPL